MFGIKRVFSCLLLLAADIITKYLTYLYLPLITFSFRGYPYGGLGVFEDFFGIQFSLNYVANTGAIWGFFAGSPALLALFRIIVIVGLAVYFCYFNRKSFLGLPLILILTGAIGNVVDFFIYGHVVDMFNFVLWGYDYPVFNLADACICVGAFWLLLGYMFSRKEAVDGS